MAPRIRSTRNHLNQLIVEVPQFGEGDEGPFGLSFSDQRTPEVDETYHTMGQAKTVADRRVAARGHRCGQGCSEWVDSN